MSYLFYATNLLLLVSFVVFVRQTMRAPEGYEDETGFHATSAAGGTNSRGKRAKTESIEPDFGKVGPRHLAA